MMLYSLLKRWIKWDWIPLDVRMSIAMAEEREYQSPENREKRWDEFCDKHDNDTVGEVVRVRWSSESHCRQWLASRGLTGNERASDVFGATPRRPVPDWFDSLGGDFRADLA